MHTKAAERQKSCSVSHESLADAIASHINLGRQRIIVAIAGPPGSGKSTASDELKTILSEQHQLAAQVVPMDGFHFDNTILEMRGLMPRKGAPETFDFGGLENLLMRLSCSYKTEDIAIPIFDRKVELSRAAARIIDRETQVLLVEGNYLLMSIPPWSRLEKYFTLTTMITCDWSMLHARLIKRWLDMGYNQAQATKKAEGNDLLNAQQVIQQSRVAHFTLTQTDNP